MDKIEEAQLMSKRVLFFMALSLLTICPLKDAFAYNDDITHPKITFNAIKSSRLERYIINVLGFGNGLNYPLSLDAKSYSIEKWIRDGSKLEDSPMCRASNHFHDPLKSWDASYMTDEPWYINAWCFISEYSKKHSNNVKKIVSVP